jgi:DNA polymerase-3 subunit delta'
MFESIRGHKRQLEFLSKALERGKLAHAYTFAGPDGIGKKMIARELARELLKSEGNNFQPDLLEIDGSEGIKIEQIRELIYKLSLKPYQAKYKVAIIDMAENMTTEAANALLKSLEEPKEYTIIILITNNPNRLPKTILSRTQKITFGPLENSEVPQNEFYKVFQSDDLPGKLIAAYELADLETPEIKQTLDSWLQNLQAELHSHATKNLAQKINQVLLSRRFLDQNVNAKLLLTNLMLSTS